MGVDHSSIQRMTDRYFLKQVSLPENMVDLLSKIAESVGGSFHWQRTTGWSWFQIPGKVGSDAFEKRRHRILHQLQENNLGNEEGVFKDGLWHEGTIIVDGLTMRDFDVTLRQHMRAAQLQASDSKVVIFTHEDQPFVPVTVEQVSEIQLQFTFMCETHKSRLLLMRYVSTAIMNHCEFTKLTIEVWAREYFWEYV